MPASHCSICSSDREVGHEYATMNCSCNRLFRWVEGHKADGIPDMTAYPGWYWLCQAKSKSKDDSLVKCLIVQDRTGNCLMPAPSPVIVAQDRGVVVSKSEVDSGLPFNVLSSFLWDASGTPDFGQLRAVRRDLLIHGTVSTPVDMVDKTGVVVVDLVRFNPFLCFMY